MRRSAVARTLLSVIALALTAACTSASGDETGEAVATASATAAASSATPAESSPPPDAPAEPPPTTPPPPPPPPTTAPPVRAVHETGWSPFAEVGGFALLHPAARVERVGFHESNHDGARELSAAATAANPVTLEGRDRGTGAHTAADIVVEPEGEIRAPVTGHVKRSGTYVLYCKHSDDYAVIAPDAQPAWEVKILHIDGVRVRRGDRVVAGETVIARRATQLPFASQVDDLRTVDPAWPHVHVEVVDPRIPDRPSPGGGC